MISYLFPCHKVKTVETQARPNKCFFEPLIQSRVIRYAVSNKSLLCYKLFISFLGSSSSVILLFLLHLDDKLQFLRRILIMNHNRHF